MNEAFEDRVRRVRERIARAAARVGRRADEITVVAATKTFGERAIVDWARSGGTDVGESYVQEAKRKRDALGDGMGDALRWHMIGRLQRNKAKRAVELFDLVHSLDGLGLAAALDRAAAALGRRLDCLIEVDLGGETTKGGVDPTRLPELLGELEAHAHLRICGLMTLPPWTPDPEGARPYFRRLRELRDRLTELPRGGGQLKDLSMGMSGDFEIAVEEGATIVRIGRALFGQRA